MMFRPYPTLLRVTRQVAYLHGRILYITQAATTLSITSLLLSLRPTALLELLLPWHIRA
jgi:hypothetical protein